MPLIESGQVTALRLFDIAHAIDLKSAEARFATGDRRGLTATPPKAMAFGVPPLALALPPVALAMGEAVVSARLYDFGVVALALTLPANGLDWDGYVALVNRLQAEIGPGGAEPWARLLDGVRRTLGPALLRPNDRTLEEDYLFAVVNRLAEPLSAEALLEQVDLIPLLTGETRPLAPGARQALLRERFSYYADDLVVLSWDRAFVLEPRGESDVLEVLEVANAQLLEMRFYNELLDEELPRIYDLVEEVRRTPFLLSSRRFARLARRLHGLVAEVTELTERAENALRVTEDVYLARVYAAAMALFRVPVVSAAVDRKLATVRETYQALFDEASASRAELLEIAILVLIALEIVLSLARH